MYEKIFIAIVFIILFVINVCGWDDEIIAYIVGVIVVILFDIIWKKYMKKKSK